MIGGELKDISLVLVGRSGNGKSSTGNAILGRDVFTPRTTNDDSKDLVVHHTAVVDTTQIKVVDGTGIGDTGEDINGGVETLSHSINSMWDSKIYAFNAIIFVLKYGVRFTKQEKDAVQCIKSIFGDDVFKRWGVIVMTYGDNFEKVKQTAGHLRRGARTSREISNLFVRNATSGAFFSTT